MDKTELRTCVVITLGLCVFLFVERTNKFLRECWAKCTQAKYARHNTETIFTDERNQDDDGEAIQLFTLPDKVANYVPRTHLFDSRHRLNGLLLMRKRGVKDKDDITAIRCTGYICCCRRALY